MRASQARNFIASLPGSRRLWVSLSVACLLGYWFFEVADYVFDDTAEGEAGAHAFDKAIAQFFQQFRSPILTQVAIDLTALGSASVLSVFALLAFAGVLGSKDRLGFLHLAIALLGAFLWPELLKGLFERGRPEGVLHLVPVRTLSFPSGHSFGAAACYATFAFFFARYVPRLRTEVFCYVLAALIVVIVGLTRIYLGVHYATDVLAGVSAGGAWAFFLAAVFSYWYGKQSRAKP
ncbi:MAG TPA: phosphatase PAP2 family protein [Verrucomicrobiae bacterium]|nr:phosphatase PAP2 family protein [Verrucomicrobiae bacterium]